VSAAPAPPGLGGTPWGDPPASPARRSPVVPGRLAVASAAGAEARDPHGSHDPRRVAIAWGELAGGDLHELSAAERARAAGIADGARRARYIAVRSFVRRVIGASLDGECYRGEFVHGRHGKPYLPGPHASLGFNVSHAGGRIVAALRRGGAVGVDIERRDRAIAANLADFVFSRDELDCLARCADWRGAFLLGWTCKEAVLKCIGCGLLRDPKRIRVYLDDDGVRDAVAHEYSEHGARLGRYRITPLPCPPDLLGVVAVRGGAGEAA